MKVNCDMCGRDTPNKSRICHRCVAGAGLHNQRSDEAEMWSTRSQEAGCWDFSEEPSEPLEEMDDESR